MNAVDVWLIILTVVVFVQALIIGQMNERINKMHGAMTRIAEAGQNTARLLSSVAQTTQAHVSSVKGFMTNVNSRFKLTEEFADKVISLVQAVAENNDGKPV